ncbi:hypothetical protein F5144DRAFT_91566 [Chaetomium tenue]|uniref:Uncharacterized protein n=1 Tax=Chaetomium tenue TaxID=1854479 RepID=A0ACB7PF06_9PEZI|nr:hypothetical protein F5144DRAFT_91566 [Chaetomium globosum]
MPEQELKRQASKEATALATTVRDSKRLTLPKGTLAAQDASRTRRLVRGIGFADDPIQMFNKLDDRDKELVVKDLLLSHCKFFHEGGASLAPADIQYFSKTGLPAADRALMRGARLSIADESENDEDNLTETEVESELYDSCETIHGQPRWPPNEEISGRCSLPVSMDDAGLVDLRHDPYCLRKHFTTFTPAHSASRERVSEKRRVLTPAHPAHPQLTRLTPIGR